MAERYRLTEKLIKIAEARSEKYHLFDSDLLGFSAVIHPTGLKAFCLHYWMQGRQRKLTIGRWPEWTVVAARERAKVLRREIDAGDDPMARREEQRAAPRIPDLINLYIGQHLPRLSPRNASDFATSWSRNGRHGWSRTSRRTTWRGCLRRSSRGGSGQRPRQRRSAVSANA